MTGRAILLLAGLGLLLLAAPAAAGSPLPEVRLLASDLRPFAGQPILLTLEIRYRSHPQGVLVPQWPQRDDFVSGDPYFPPPAREGPFLVERAVRTLRPLAAGLLRLEGGGVRIDGRLVAAPPLLLRVRPLPQRGRPPGFASAVGPVKMEVSAAGEGPREVTILLESLDPGGLPRPSVTAGPGERITPLPSPETAGGNRFRRLRYWFDPGPGRRGQLLATLPVFDPETESYRLLEAGAGKPAPSIRQAWALGAGLLVALGLVVASRKRFWRAPADLDRELEKLLGRPRRGMTRDQVVESLRHRGIAEALVRELEGLERMREETFAGGGSSRPLPDDPKRRRELAWRLRNHVDKRGPIS